jgi:hypothetical protein
LVKNGRCAFFHSLIVFSCSLFFSPLLYTAGRFIYSLSYFFSSPVLCTYLSVIFFMFPSSVLLLHPRSQLVFCHSSRTRVSFVTLTGDSVGKNAASSDQNQTHAHLTAVGIQGSAPKTFPRNVWLKDVMVTAFGDDTVYVSFHDQLDGFVLKMDWPPRSHEEKTNNLTDASKDPFLKGLQAVLDIYYYGIPITAL